MRRLLLISVVLAFFSTGVPSVEAGLIVVNSDEWTLSDVGFAQSPDAGTFINNVLSLFTGGGPASIHAYSSNFGYTGASLNNALVSAGHTYTTGTGIAFDLATLLAYDAIFLGGNLINAPQAAVLIDYVNAGGNVYLAGGTSFSNPGAVAAAFNPFLGAFGLSFANVNNPGLFSGNIDVTGAGHPIFTGVSTLYQNGPQAVSGTGVVFSHLGFGAIAVAGEPAQVPEPSIGLLLAASMVAAGLRRRQRRRRQPW